MDLQIELENLVDAFNEAGIDYALCEGVALAIHGIPRATDDIDMLIVEEDLESIKTLVRPLGFTLTSELMTFQPGTKHEQTIYRITKAEGRDYLILDLLFVGFPLQSTWDRRELIGMGDRKVSVVSKVELIDMKRRAGRPQDLVDAEKLSETKPNE